MTVAVKEIRILRKDTDDNLYAIPERLIDSFAIMNEAIMLADWGTDEWFTAKSELEYMFGDYLKSSNI